MPQPTRDELLAATDAVLATINPRAQVETVRQTSDAAYVAYVFGLILRAAQLVATPGSLMIRSGTTRNQPNQQPHRFVVRGAPGSIYSQARDYGYAVFRCNRSVYEIHISAQYFGSSRVLHEFDISIIDAADAANARTNHRSPTSGKARIVFECKFYAGTIGIALGREFVGLLSDFSSAKSARPVTNSNSDSVRMYLTERVKLKLSQHLVPDSAEEAMFINAVAEDLRSRLR